MLCFLLRYLTKIALLDNDMFNLLCQLDAAEWLLLQVLHLVLSCAVSCMLCHKVLCFTVRGIASLHLL